MSAEQIVQSAVEKLAELAPSIDPFVSWLSAACPARRYADMEQTFDLMDAMGRVNPRTQHYGIFLYTPFPSPLLDSLPASSRRPQSLEEWGGDRGLPLRAALAQPAYVRRLRAVSAVTRYAFSPALADRRARPRLPGRPTAP